jgi:hypothetical protein
VGPRESSDGEAFEGPDDWAIPGELNTVAAASKTSDTSNKRRATGWPVSSIGDMIYLLVRFFTVAGIVEPTARVANEASENLRGRDNPTFVDRVYGRTARRRTRSRSSVLFGLWFEH